MGKVTFPGNYHTFRKNGKSKVQKLTHSETQKPFKINYTKIQFTSFSLIDYLKNLLQKLWANIK